MTTTPAKFGLDHRLHFHCRGTTVLGEWERIDAEAVVATLLDTPGEDNLADFVADAVEQACRVAYAQGVADASRAQVEACKALTS